MQSNKDLSRIRPTGIMRLKQVMNLNQSLCAGTWLCFPSAEVIYSSSE